MDPLPLKKLVADMDARLAAITESIREQQQMLTQLTGNDVLLARQLLEAQIAHQELLTTLLTRMQALVRKSLH